MIPAAISSWVLVLSDRYVIGLSQSAADVGLYGTAYGLGDKIMGLITAPLLIAIAPVLVQTFEKRGQELAQQVQTQLTRYYAMVTVPLVFGLTVIARPFMEIFTGPLYREAYPILPVVAAGVMLYGMTQIANNGLAMHKKSVIMMRNTVVAAAFQVVLNLALVPRFGYAVAAWSTLAAYLLLLVLAAVRSRPYMAWRVPWADLGRIGASSAVMATALIAAFRWFPASLWMLLVQALAGIVIYTLTLWAAGGFRPDELAFAREMVTTARSRVSRRRRDS
jgi:O-antigen/teichoic acid export membrane protein